MGIAPFTCYLMSPHCPLFQGLREAVNSVRRDTFLCRLKKNKLSLCLLVLSLKLNTDPPPRPLHTGLLSSCHRWCQKPRGEIQPVGLEIWSVSSGERASAHKTTFGVPVVIGGGEGMKRGEGWTRKLQHFSLPPSSPQGFSEVELRWGGFRAWGGRHKGREVGERPWAWSSALRFTAGEHVHMISGVAVGQWLQSHFTVTEIRFQGGGRNFQRAQSFKRQGRATPKSKNLVLEGPHATKHLPLLVHL